MRHRHPAVAVYPGGGFAGSVIVPLPSVPQGEPFPARERAAFWFFRLRTPPLSVYNRSEVSEMDMNSIIDPRPIIQKRSYDVIVAGGGIAGVAAAVSAAREGARVLLMEKGIVLGGLATAGLISWYEPLCDSRGTKMIGGAAEELIRLAAKYGFDDLPAAWKDGQNAEKRPDRYATHFSPTIFAAALDAYLAESGADIVLDCMAVYPVMEGERAVGVAAETKQGRVFYGAKALVDATGDASLFYQAGLPTRNGENYMTFVAHGYRRESVMEYAASEDPSMNQMRKWWFFGSDLYGNGHPEALPKLAGVTAEEITDFVLTGRKMLFRQLQTEDREARDVAALPTLPQLRTIRRIVGACEFTATDREICPDSVGSCGDFRPAGWGKHYHIPYRSLYSPKCASLLAAGRVISANREGWEASRVIPVCALTGQAAGTAAAMAALGDGDVRNVCVPALRTKLKRNGVLFVDEERV